MPKLRVLSGSEVTKILTSFGFVIKSQVGSHIKLIRHLPTGDQTLTVPNHKELGRGTTRDIFSQALAYIPEQELRSHFYTE